MNEEWLGMSPPNAKEKDTLLRHGANGRKCFVDWFNEKVISDLSILRGLTFSSFTYMQLMQHNMSIKLTGKRSHCIYACRIEMGLPRF